MKLLSAAFPFAILLLVGCKTAAPVNAFVSNPGAYATRKVAFDGFWILGFENSYFLPTSSEGNVDIWVRANWSALDAQSPILAKQLREMAIYPRGMSYPEMRIAIKGEALLEKKADAGPLGGFGHLGSYEYQLSIERIAEIKHAH